MALETGAYIADLNVANPAAADPKSQGDDHLRLLKTAAKGSFPGFAGVVMATGTESGSSNAYVVTTSPAPAALTASMLVVFKATHANTGAATLQINALTAKTLKSDDGSDLESGDIESGGLVAAFYDGTNFLMLSPNDRAARSGDDYTGTHNFTAATVYVPTQTAADNSLKAASTAYVDAADALKANIASPTLTGTPAAPTAAPGTNTTQLATTAFATQLAFQAALPVQSVPSMLYSNGTVASWRPSFIGDSGSGGQLGPVPAPAAGDAAKYLRADATWHLAPSCPDVIIQDQKASGTNGGALTNGSWQDRELNTVVRNVGSIGSLSANAVTLPAGTWLLRASAAIEGPVSNSARVRARLYNSTDSTALAQSEQSTLIGDSSSVGGGANPQVLAVVTFAAPKAIKLQTYNTAAPCKAGSAMTTGEVEVYATFEATQLA